MSHLAAEHFIQVLTSFFVLLSYKADKTTSWDDDCFKKIFCNAGIIYSLFSFNYSTPLIHHDQDFKSKLRLQVSKVNPDVFFVDSCDI